MILIYNLANRSGRVLSSCLEKVNAGGGSGILLLRQQCYCLLLLLRSNAGMVMSDLEVDVLHERVV